jgi:diaminohydroxyphosphoribosylaminopyrimidine deaminase/5-amino-6-(5-phosphoribosylamino)uracil reductase
MKLTGIDFPSTLYVSLEPCAHFGKTPPCADLIIQQQIPGVVVGTRDPFKQVDGRGIEKLQASGVNVEIGIMAKECRDLNKRFFTFHTEQRPYIILKWAETKDGFIATMGAPTTAGDFGRAQEIIQDGLQISNEYSNRLVHKWK